jgi:uncharacterized membrane protein YhaH (DUF805 family)
MNYYFSFEGRVSRESFWKVIIGAPLSAFLAVSLLGFISFLITMLTGFKLPSAITTLAFVVIGIFALISYISIIVRRFHDRSKSGWWALIGLIPVLGFWWILIECGFFQGTVGQNQFGPDSLETSTQPQI